MKRADRKQWLEEPLKHRSADLLTQDYINSLDIVAIQDERH